MVDRAVSLPEPRPEDDEDVVWGLSTASALWARGERKDAIVWLRRAADAASSAGQDFRASELGMYATELEDTMTARASVPEEGNRPSVMELDEVEEVPPAPPPLPPRALTVPPVKGPSLTPIPASPPTQPAGTFSSPPSSGAPLHGLMSIASGPASVARPPQAEASRPPAVASTPPRPKPLSSAPPQAPPPAPSSPASHRAPLPEPAAHLGVNEPAMMVTSSVPEAPTLANFPETPAAPPASQAATHRPGDDAGLVPESQAATVQPNESVVVPVSQEPTVRPAGEGVPAPRKKAAAPRGPILDPWSEDASPPTSRTAITAQFPVMSGPKADEVLLSVRARPTVSRSDSDDNEVVTSAAPLETTLRKGNRQAPPPPVKKAAEADAKAAASSPRGAIDRQKASVPPKSQGPGSVAGHDGTLKAPAAPVVAPPPAHPLAATQPSATIASAHPPSHKPPPPEPPAPPPPVIEPLPPPPAAEYPPTLRDESLAGATSEVIPSTEPAPPAAVSQAEQTPPATERPNVGGLALDEVDAFADLPSDVQYDLASVARIESLNADEEVSGFGAALLLAGEAVICSTLVDAPASRAVRGTVVPSRGSLPDPVPLRVVASAGGGRVAVWDQSVVEDALKECPWVMEELVARADRLQALAGATIGPLGDIDEPYRNMLLERLTLRVAEPHERLAQKGEKLGIMLIGAGSVDLLGDDQDTVARPGDFLFPRAVLENQPAPLEAHAGSQGAVLLVGDRQIAQELFVTAPPLVAILSGDG